MQKYGTIAVALTDKSGGVGASPSYSASYYTGDSYLQYFKLDSSSKKIHIGLQVCWHL